MKLKSLLLPSLFCCALGIGSAGANPLTVYMSTHVTTVSDPAGVLSGIAGAPIVVGQIARGQYRYETTPSLPLPPLPGPPMVPYVMNAGQGAIRISMGSLVLQNDPQAPFEVDMFMPNSQPLSPAGEMLIHNWNNNGTPDYLITDMRVDFQDPSGHAPSSSVLPAVPLDLTRFSVATVSVSGIAPAGSWSVTFAIDSVYLIPPSAAGWSISPATGVLARQQRIDAALLLPAGSQVQSVQTFIGGNPGPFSFPFPPAGPTPGPQSPCTVLPPNSQGQPVIICADPMSALPDGLNEVEWQIQLMDGTTLDKVMVWEVIP